MKKIALSLIASALFLVPFAQAATTEVKVKDDFFKPKPAEIKKGDKVHWVWKGSNPHNVAGKKPGSSEIAFRSAIKKKGDYSHKFGKVGTWKILCEVHPDMKMRVVVSGRGS